MHSIISYKSLPSLLLSSEPNSAFHPFARRAALVRLRFLVTDIFGHIGLEYRLAILSALLQVMKTPKCAQYYEIILESFGVPVFKLRNLAQSLQPPEERTFCVIHLNELVKKLTAENKEEACWECGIVIGFTVLLGAIAAIWVFGCLGVAQQPTAPSPFLSLYNH